MSTKLDERFQRVQPSEWPSAGPDAAVRDDAPPATITSGGWARIRGRLNRLAQRPARRRPSRHTPRRSEAIMQDACMAREMYRL